MIGFVTTYRCKCQGKICSLVIDSESCANIVSLEMVNKLKLKAEPHPKPYEISWFKKSGEVKVIKHCFVFFFFYIGKNYKDEVWCDIFPMEVSHILLGIPWQFDRGVIHDGCKTRTPFRMENVEIINRFALKR
jgi:hypothetical protein